MLKKLLKYDLKAVFKYWWIAAISSLGLSALGGICITILSNQNDGGISPPQILIVSAILMLILAIIGIIAFSLISLILIFIRFYKNFFSDEGYLTFTLPVKRTQQLNSKIILSTVTQICTSLFICLNFTIMLVIGFSKHVFTQEFWEKIVIFVEELFDLIDGYVAIYIIEIILLLVISMVFSNLFIYACITFACMITKKAKVITAIGIYYVANGIFTFLLQIFFLFSMRSLSTLFAKLPENSLEPAIAILGLGILLVLALFCAILYTFEYWMLDRKLNLA